MNRPRSRVGMVSSYGEEILIVFCLLCLRVLVARRAEMVDNLVSCRKLIISPMQVSNSRSSL